MGDAYWVLPVGLGPVLWKQGTCSVCVWVSVLTRDYFSSFLLLC